jgi:hypothetical protein
MQNHQSANNELLKALKYPSSAGLLPYDMP